ncbi:MAG TPA: hypothetical protein VF399_04005 [bacterium]
MWILITLLLNSGFGFDQVKVDQVLETLRTCNNIYNQQNEINILAKQDRGSTITVNALDLFNQGMSMEFDGRADIVVGDVPGETLLISGYFYNNGNILIIGDGVLLLDQADFNLDGTIYIMNHGVMRADSSTLSFIQHYIYHRGLNIGDSAKCAIYDCETHFSGYPMGVWIGYWGEIVMSNVHNYDWITAVVSNNGKADLDDVDITGEWLYGDQCYASFRRVNNFLSWFFFPSLSVVQLAFPPGDTVLNFYVDSTLSNVHGIGYHVELDSCTNCMWAAIPLRGSDVTIDSSMLRVTGIMLEGIDTFAISGLVNGLHYDDYTLPVNDRNYHLINSSVQTWNLYPDDSVNVTLTNSIFGELCAYGNSYVTIMNAYCDGSGGHLEASTNAFLLTGFSSIFADIITKNRGMCVVGYCAMPYGNIWVTNASIMIIINTQFPDDPVVSDTGIVFVAAVSGPANAATDDTVAVQGSAWVDRGPNQPVDFGFYRMSFRLVGDSAWIPFGDSNTVEVRRSTLENWNTVGLAPGNYELRLVLKDNVGDSVECSKVITLRVTDIEEEAAQNDIESAYVRRVTARSFLFTNPEPGRNISVFNLTGQRVYSTAKREINWTAKASGVYFVQIDNFVRKIVAY